MQIALDTHSTFQIWQCNYEVGQECYCSTEGVQGKIIQYYVVLPQIFTVYMAAMRYFNRLGVRTPAAHGQQRAARAHRPNKGEII